jgi:hypothetical protein
VRQVTKVKAPRTRSIIDMRINPGARIYVRGAI